MPTCPRCGKVLCNEQSLQNHMKSNLCKPCNDKTKNTSIQMRNNQDYDYSFYCDLKGVITSISESDANKLEYKSNEMIGRSGYDFMHANDRFYVSQIHMASLIHKVPNVVNFRRITKSGDVFTVIGEATINETQNEIFVYEKFIKFDDQNAINFILNKDFSYCWVNCKYTEVYGYTLEELQNQNIKDVNLWDNESKSKIGDILVNLANASEFISSHTIVNKHGKEIKVKGLAIDKGNFYMVSNNVANNPSE